MKCPKCEQRDDHVIDSRASEEGEVIRRRRQCKNCGHRYTTYERIEKASPLKVIKKHGKAREDFNPSKIKACVNVVCHKLEISASTQERVTEEIIQRIEKESDREISYKAISKIVMEELKKLHKIAYNRYGSAYADFENMDDFLEDISAIMPAQKKEEPEEEESSSIFSRLLPLEDPVKPERLREVPKPKGKKTEPPAKKMEKK